MPLTTLSKADLRSIMTLHRCATRTLADPDTTAAEITTSVQVLTRALTSLLNTPTTSIEEPQVLSTTLLTHLDDLVAAAPEAILTAGPAPHPYTLTAGQYVTLGELTDLINLIRDGDLSFSLAS